MATLSTKHPQYVQYHPDLVVMYDTNEGSRHIKSRKDIYLKPTVSMVLDGFGGVDTKCKGNVSYDAYISRAKFPEYVNEAITNYLGLLHKQPATISLPESMKYLETNATAFGEGLLQLLHRINMNQLLFGRLGLLAELADHADATQPYIALYSGFSIINWDDGTAVMGKSSLNMVVLDETGFVFDPATFTWDNKEKWRVLQLGSATEEDANNTGAVYRQGVFTEDDWNNEGMKTISLKGKALQEIPFTFCNSGDITPNMSVPPLKKLADDCLCIYRGEADYRQNLHLQGQDTLVVVGGLSGTAGDEDLRVGAGARIDVDTTGDVKYVGTSSKGLSEQREAIKTDKAEAELRAGQFVGASQGNQESGDALKTRIATRTTSLVDIAMTGAAALENSLKQIARWIGADENEVSVKPNLDFSKNALGGQEMVQIITSRNIGAPLSLETLHTIMVNAGYTNLSFEEEMAKIEKEKPGVIKPIVEQIDKSTGQQAGSGMANENTARIPNNDPTAPVDSRS